VVGTTDGLLLRIFFISEKDIIIIIVVVVLNDPNYDTVAVVNFWKYQT
jgi:hypothetical protein